MLLIKNARVYAPASLGKKDILTANGALFTKSPDISTRALRCRWVRR